jgi:hypothetical protein
MHKGSFLLTHPDTARYLRYRLWPTTFVLATTSPSLFHLTSNCTSSQFKNHNR